MSSSTTRLATGTTYNRPDDRQGPGPSRGEARATQAHRRGGRSHGRGALHDPRACGDDERARSRGCRADLPRGGPDQRAARGRAATRPDARAGARAGAGRGRRRLSGAEPGCHVSDELLNLTAAQQAERIAAGEISSAELFEFWRVRAAGDDLGAYLWVPDAAPEDAGTLPPIAVKDLFCVEGVPSTAG